jgi:hypothetical protein
MGICRFVVNVPNPGPGGAAIDLSLEKGSIDELVRLGFPKTELLEIQDAGITLDPCAEGGNERLELKLGSRESAEVYVVLQTAGGQGAALLHLVDRRGDETGGVMLACFEGIDSDPAGTVITPELPCPIELAAPIYACDADDATQEDARGVVVGGWSTLAAVLVNAGSESLAGAFAYLEHLGGADAEFEPGTWQLGDLAPGDKFFTVWRVRADSAAGPLRPCIVVGSEKTDPVRLVGEVALWERRPWQPDTEEAKRKELRPGARRARARR